MPGSGVESVRPTADIGPMPEQATPRRHPVAILSLIAAAQVVVLGVGWLFMYESTHRRVASSVRDVIIENNRRVSGSLAGLIGELPGAFDPDHPGWAGAQRVVEQLSLPAGGFACITDAAGFIACHPRIHDEPGIRAVRLGAELLADVDGGGRAPVGERAASGFAEGLIEFPLDGTHYVAATPLGEGGATLLVHQSAAGLSNAASHVTLGLLAQMAGVAAVIVACTVGIGFALSRRYVGLLSRWGERLEATVAERTSQLRTSREAIVNALAQLAEFRDNDTAQHVHRISAYSEVMAAELRAEFPEIDAPWAARIGLASRLHDIGKVAVPDSVLLKPGRLDEHEYEQIKRHTIVAADTLLAVHRNIQGDPLVAMAIEIALYHHERWDGSGYPYGLAGEQIPLSARLVAVVDVFDALMSPRVYKRAMSAESTLEIINSSAGSHFDPRIVAAFNRCAPRLVAIHRSMSDGAAPTLAAA